MKRIPYEDEYRAALRFLRSRPYQKLGRSPLRFPYSQVSTVVIQKLGLVHRRNAETFWNEKMNVYIPEPVSVTIHRYRLYEPGLTFCMMNYLKPGQIFVDVGAHFGYFTLLAAMLVGDSGQVHSFEPTPGTYEVLRENCRAKANIHINNVALWSMEDEIEFSDYGLQYSAFNSLYDPRLDEDVRELLVPNQRIVPAVPLDEYVDENDSRPNFIKIDAESAEFQIMQGMEDILSKDRPLVSLEVGDENVTGVAKSSDLIHFLMTRGYRPFEMSDYGIVDHEVRERYTMANLLFVPEEDSQI